MTIALITDNLNSGGAQRQLVTLAIGLKNRGVNVLFIIYNSGYHYEPMLQANGIPLFKILKSSKYDVLSTIRIIDVIRSNKVNGIIAFLFTPTIVGAMAKIFSNRKTKLIVSERAYPHYAKERFTTKLARWLYRFADTITVNSLSQFNFMSENFPTYCRKLTFIPNGLDLSTFVPPQEKVATQSLELLCIGHVNSIKNTKLVIHALHLLKKTSDVNFQLTWIGRTFDINGKNNPYFEECKSLLTEFELDKNWKWISETANLLPYYHHADLLIHASIGEGFSNVVMEALSCGVPVVISDVNDNGTVVKNGINGFLFPSGNAAAIAEIVLKYRETSADRRSELAAAARSTAEASFSEENMIENYMKLLEA